MTCNVHSLGRGTTRARKTTPIAVGAAGIIVILALGTNPAARLRRHLTAGRSSASSRRKGLRRPNGGTGASSGGLRESRTIGSSERHGTRLLLLGRDILSWRDDLVLWLLRLTIANRGRDVDLTGLAGGLVGDLGLLLLLINGLDLLVSTWRLDWLRLLVSSSLGELVLLVADRSVSCSLVIGRLLELLNIPIK